MSDLKSHQIKMAKQIAILCNKSSKKRQAHLLCLSLIEILKVK